MTSKRTSEYFALFFSFVCLSSCFVPALAYSVESSLTDIDERAYNTKSNNIKKAPQIENKETKTEARPAPIPKDKVKEGFQWGNLLRTGLSMLGGSQQTSGTSTPLNKVDPTSQLTSSDFSWTKIISLGLQLILSFFGNDSVAIDKMDPGSPIEAFLTAVIAYFTGSNNPQEVSVMAKQATELWGIVVSLLDALRTSFSQRSFEARAIGSNDLMADAAVASTSVLKSYILSYNTEDDICIQKYICEANRDCANETSDTGYLFCQMATYAYSYLLEGRSYTPFEVINDAGRMGRTGEDCDAMFKDCSEKPLPRYF